MELLRQQSRFDRDYWRSQPDIRLCEEARDSEHELCIALGERLDALNGEYEAELDKLRDQLVDWERAASKLDDEKYELEVEVDNALATIERLKQEVEDLETERRNEH